MQRLRGGLEEDEMSSETAVWAALGQRPSEGKPEDVVGKCQDKPIRTGKSCPSPGKEGTVEGGGVIRSREGREIERQKTERGRAKER